MPVSVIAEPRPATIAITITNTANHQRGNSAGRHRGRYATHQETAQVIFEWHGHFRPPCGARRQMLRRTAEYAGTSALSAPISVATDECFGKILAAIFGPRSTDRYASEPTVKILKTM